MRIKFLVLVGGVFWGEDVRECQVYFCGCGDFLNKAID